MDQPAPARAMLGYHHGGRGRLYRRQLDQYPRHTDLATRIEVSRADVALPPGRILDIGAGAGRVARALAARGARRIVALDASYDMLREGAAQTAPGAPISAVCGLANDTLPVVDAAFDGAYCFGVLNLFEDWRPLVRPVAAALRPGAPFVFNHRCADAIAHRGTPTRRRYGAFAADTLTQDLAGLGLTLAWARPGPLLVPADLARDWLGPDATVTPLNVFALRCWLERALGRVENVDTWLALELSLAEVLPLKAALQSIVVARAPGGPAPDTQSPDLPPATTRDQVVAVLESDVGRACLDDPGGLALLVLLAPHLRRLCGDDPLDAVAARRADMRGALAQDIAATLRTTATARLRYALHRLPTTALNLTNRAASRFARLRARTTAKARPGP